ncbi:MAG: hypothetical protein IKF83_04110 [Clostridia bacterium]|nr:hypothetical protein [Clostridia bacterium]
MEKRAKENNNTTMIVIAVIAVIVVIAIVIALVATRGNKNEGSTNISAEQAQSDNNSRLAQVQEKIDAQEKVINDLNEKLSPLVEERTKLEEELMQLTSSDTEVTEAPAEEVPTEEAPVEENTEATEAE